MCVLNFFLPDFPGSVASSCQSSVEPPRKKLPKQSSGPNAVSSVFIRQAAASCALCQEIHDAGYIADSGYLHILSAS